MVNYLIKDGGTDSSNSEGVTPLMASLKGGHVKISDMLLATKKAHYVLEEKDNDDRNVFHYAFSSRTAEESIEALLRFFSKTSPTEVEQLLTNKDLDKETPFHILAHQQLDKESFKLIFKRMEDFDIDVFRCLTEKNSTKENPLHHTTKCDNTSFLEAVLSKNQGNEETIYHLLTAEDENSNSVLHLATQHKQTKTAKLILDFLSQNSMETFKYISMKNFFGWTPFSGAVASGDFEFVKEMLRSLSKEDRKTVVNQSDFSNAAPLHLAAKYGHVKVFDILMKNYAKITKKGYEDKTALDIAIDKAQQGIICTIINGAMWREAFKMTSTTEKGAVDTPLRKLIRQFPHLAEELLDKCYDIEILSKVEARKNNVSREVVKMNVDFIEDTYKYKQNKNGNVNTFYHKDGAGLHDSGKDHEVDISNHPMMIMVDERKLDLLQHPLCLAIIMRKWRLYGRMFYYFQLAYYLLFLVAVTTYVLTSHSPVQNPGLFNCTAFFYDYLPPNITSPELLISENSGWNDFSRISIMVLFSIRVILYFGNQEFRTHSFQMISEEFDMRQIAEMSVVFFDAIVYILSLYIALHNFSNFTNEDISITLAVRSCAQWQFSAITITFAWLNLLTYMTLLYGIGKYIILFQDVLTSFVSVAMVFTIQLVAFALGFHILLSNNDNFGTPQDALLKTLIMWSGEFDFADIFFEDIPPDGFGPLWDTGHETVPFPGLTYSMFVIFFLALSIVAINVLVGLTVDDIRNFLENADLRKLKMILKYILQMERTFLQKRSTFRKEEEVVDIKPITKQSHYEIAFTNDIISRQKIWEKIEKKLADGRRKAEIERPMKELKDFIDRKLKRLEGMRYKGPDKLSDFPVLSSIDDNELGEEFHELIADVRLIKGIVTNTQACSDVEETTGAEKRIEPEKKGPKEEDIEEIKAENNLLRMEVRKLESQLKEMMDQRVKVTSV